MSVFKERAEDKLERRQQGPTPVAVCSKPDRLSGEGHTSFTAGRSHTPQTPIALLVTRSHLQAVAQAPTEPGTYARLTTPSATHCIHPIGQDHHCQIIAPYPSRAYHFHRDPALHLAPLSSCYCKGTQSPSPSNSWSGAVSDLKSCRYRADL